MSLTQLKQNLTNGMTTQPVIESAPEAQPQTPPRQLKVMICLPSGRTWEARTGTAVSGIATFSALQGISIGICNLEGSMVSKQRNDLVALALKNDPDFIFQMDTDMVYPPNTLTRLIAHNKDIVGATYNKRVPPYETLGTLKGPRPTEDELRQGGLREALFMPGGCMLIKADVFRNLSWPWYYESYQWDGKDGVEALKNFLRGNYAEPVPEELLVHLEGSPLAEWVNKMQAAENVRRWEYFSEDLNFCRKAIRAGYTLWTDMDLSFQSVHLGTIEVTAMAPPDMNAAVVPAIM